MEEYEQLIKRRFRDQKLPQSIVTDFIRKSKEKGLLLDDELDEIPKNVTLIELKNRLRECRRTLFNTSLESFHRDIEVEEIELTQHNEKENKQNHRIVDEKGKIEEDRRQTINSNNNHHERISDLVKYPNHFINKDKNINSNHNERVSDLNQYPERVINKDKNMNKNNHERVSDFNQYPKEVINKDININKNHDPLKTDLNECQNKYLIDKDKKNIVSEQMGTLTRRNRNNCKFDINYNETELEKKERRLKNVLSAYYQYEIAKIKEEQPIKSSCPYNKKVLYILITVAMSFFIILLIDLFDIFRPY